MEGLIAYALAKKITASVVAGVSSMSVEGQTLIIECTDGTQLELEFPTPEDGVSITDVEINQEGHLICTMSDGTEIDAGKLPGGSGAELSEDITSVVDVGGIKNGKKYNAGTPLETIISDMLQPLVNPTFVAPSASLTYDANAIYKVGTIIPAKTATIGYNPGAIMLNGAKQNNRAGAATGYAIATSGADTDYSNSGSGSSFNVSSLTKSTKGSITITGTVNYGQGPQPKDSQGNDYQSPLPAGSTTASKTINFILPYYYGKSASSSIADFTGLTEDVSTKGNKTYRFTTNNEYMIFAYDSSYGNLTSILDSNGFETISGWNKASITVDGFTYALYVSKSPTTDTNAAFTFKY